MMTFGSPQCIIRLVPSDGPVLLFLSAPPDFEKKGGPSRKKSLIISLLAGNFSNSVGVHADSRSRSDEELSESITIGRESELLPVSWPLIRKSIRN